MDIVIIGRQEGKYVDEILQSVSANDGKVIYVADRCTDGTLDSLKKYKNVDAVNTFDLGAKLTDGRLTSYCRNVGLERCSADSDVLFLDGDRYVVDGDLTSLRDIRSDVATVMLESDVRRIEDFAEHYGTVFNWFFSAGLFMRRSAINKVIEFQGKLFNEGLQRYWGIEDTSLGDVCYHLGVTAELTDAIKLHGGFNDTKLKAEVLKQRFEYAKRNGVKFKVNQSLFFNKSIDKKP